MRISESKGKRSATESDESIDESRGRVGMFISSDPNYFRDVSSSWAQSDGVSVRRWKKHGNLAVSLESLSGRCVLNRERFTALMGQFDGSENYDLSTFF
ncbi:hypothetical protein KIN20_013903 [Parelaphostrongylus tenuis]|uniref:Uncharacterized protein n=1 Tax=Parelaphostrongylus tenuis TaxID=148309 RepID=A0AAD5MWQ6_PARTN|nr:hypothetical protein KIN20_013903 [Parelaphostrongylus tenuis]